MRRRRCGPEKLGLAARTGMQRAYKGSLVTLSQSDFGDLNGTGFRAGAEEPGTCATRSRVLSDANGVTSGIWECTPGAFTFPDRPNTESIVLLQGRVRLTDVDSGKVTELNAGDAAVLEKGSSVRWEILETARKYFVVA